MIKTYQWAVVGAGPAGIAAIGKLLDQGIHGENIIWIDPTFTVGDFGTLWRSVPSNTKVDLFLKFLYASKSFSYASCKEKFALHHEIGSNTCDLHLMADPLQWITQELQSKVAIKLGRVHELSRSENSWQLHCLEDKILALRVILAVGATPKTLPFSKPIIPLEDALDRKRLTMYLSPNETIGVFGSSHSAILVLKNLIENSQKVINFYRSPLLYAIYHKDFIQHDDTGLKGTTAEWAKKNLEGSLPRELQRVPSSEENINQYLSLCDKVIYAIGFERRLLPVEGLDPNFHTMGKIGLGLYGFGIAYPEPKTNPLGIMEYRVGLWKFMDYLERVLPQWMTDPIS